MSLEERIIEWSATRPPWQRIVLRRVALGEFLSDNDYDELFGMLLATNTSPNVTFSLEQLPQVQVGAPPVVLISIADIEHVNALASKNPLTFEPNGLSIIYGDNGSGKSGYARLLKLIARARHREEILSDVFRDTANAKPRAILAFKVGDKETSLTWPVSTLPELQRMLFYDESCGDAYLETESDFLYRPSALFVMDGLIKACGALRSRIDAKLEDIGRSTIVLPVVDEELKQTEIGNYLEHLSASSSFEDLQALLDKFDTSAKIIDNLKKEEARLRSVDTDKERQKLSRQVDKLDSLRIHFEGLQKALGDELVTDLQEERGRVKTLQEAADILAKSFNSEPLRGVGTSPWKELWESARHFSEMHAYPSKPFPIVTSDAFCVLCQQPVDEEARKRFSRFEQFVQGDTQSKLREAYVKWSTRVDGLTNFRTSPAAIETIMTDLEVDYAELVCKMRSLVALYEAARIRIVGALPSTKEIPFSGLLSSEVVSQLEAAIVTVNTAVKDLSNTEKLKYLLAEVVAKRKELEFFQKVKNQKKAIAAEIARLKERNALEVAKNETATGPITKKVLELSEDSITEVVRDTFTRETDRLHLERVTIAKARGDRGALLHQPKLVGARQNVTLPNVFSEGEKSALGLAAFFTEAQLNASKSALILDDPVSSLDHIRREFVATRLAELARNRQVVVFTHDVAFVADLKREAKNLSVPIGERAVMRSRGVDNAPGACSFKHPWKAKDVEERLGKLGNELVRIKKECKDWDEAAFENEVALWAGSLSETWERIFSQEIVGSILAEGGLEVRPNMVKVLAHFTNDDDREFQVSYSRISQWAKRHDKSVKINYVAPEISALDQELTRVTTWFKRIKTYKNK
jgi:energy-coupling factor transporter ATP-binding protein EcfA2